MLPQPAKIPVGSPFAGGIAEELNIRAQAAGWAVHCDTALAFDHIKLNAMRDIWLARSTGKLPMRSQFSARDLMAVLPNLAILDIHAAEGGRRRYRYRYVGTSVVERFGELTGRYIDDFVPPALLPKTLAYFDAVAAAGKPLRVVTNFELSAVNYLQAEGLLLPLAEDGVTANMIISVSYFKLRPVVDPNIALN